MFVGWNFGRSIPVNLPCEQHPDANHQLGHGFHIVLSIVMAGVHFGDLINPSIADKHLHFIFGEEMFVLWFDLNRSVGAGVEIIASFGCVVFALKFLNTM